MLRVKPIGCILPLPQKQSIPRIMKNEPAIYLITCQRPGKLPLYYVGQSQGVRKRLNQHRASMRRGNHHNRRMQHCFEMYGEAAFVFEVLEDCAVSELDARESWWLEWMAPSRFSFNIGTDPVAPMRGVKFSREHAKKIGDAIRGERHYAFGTKKSDEAKAALSAKLKGIPKSIESRANYQAAVTGEKNPMFGKCGALSAKSKAVIGVHLVTGEEIRFESSGLAAASGFDQGSISKACNGSKKWHKGYAWRLDREPAPSHDDLAKIRANPYAMRYVKPVQ
jgi:group I intron endonuclease